MIFRCLLFLRYWFCGFHFDFTHNYNWLNSVYETVKSNRRKLAFHRFKANWKNLCIISCAMLIIPVSACITLAYNAERAFIPAVAIRFQNWGENRKQYSNAWKEKKKCGGGSSTNHCIWECSTNKRFCAKFLSSCLPEMSLMLSITKLLH